MSPGTLPDNLTVESIKLGVSVVRNPILVSFISKGLLPYRGTGSGVRRALESWSHIEFVDDRVTCTFKVVVQRRPSSEEAAGASSRDSFRGTDATVNATANATANPDLTELQKALLEEVRRNPAISYDELALVAGRNRITIVRNFRKLRQVGILDRIGSDKTGKWVVLDM